MDAFIGWWVWNESATLFRNLKLVLRLNVCYLLVTFHETKSHSAQDFLKQAKMKTLMEDKKFNPWMSSSLLDYTKMDQYKRVMNFVNLSNALTPRLCFQAIRCTVPSCACECFTPGKDNLRNCESCKHGWVSHGKLFIY